MIRISRQENKDLVAHLIFRDADSLAACVGKKKNICAQKILGASWKPLSQIVPSKAEYFGALIIFICRVEAEISLFYKHRTVQLQLTTENHKPSRQIVHVTLRLLAVHRGRKELVKSLFTGVPSPVRPFSHVFFFCIFSAPLPNSSRLSTLSERLEQAHSRDTTIKRTQLSADDWSTCSKTD